MKTPAVALRPVDTGNYYRVLKLEITAMGVRQHLKRLTAEGLVDHH